MYTAIQYLRTQNITTKNVIEILSMSMEMKPILGVTVNQSEDLSKLRDPDFKPKIGNAQFFAFQKPFYLILGYMNGKQIKESLLKDLFYIQRKVRILFVALSEVAIAMAQGQILQEKLPMQSLFNIINSFQLFYQGLWLTKSGLEQLPHLDETLLAPIKRKLKKSKGFHLDNVLKMDSSEREKLFHNIEPSQLNDIEACIKTFPNMEVKVSAYVDDDQENDIIRKGDIYKIKIEINDLNLQEGQTRGFIHSKNYPFPKNCHYFLILLDKEDKIYCVKSITSNEKHITEEFDCKASYRGKHEFKVLLKPDCYIEMDIEKTLEFEVIAKDMKKMEDEYFIHPDDLAACKQKSFMTQLMGNQEEDSEEEEEEDAPNAEKENEIATEKNVKKDKESSEEEDSDMEIPDIIGMDD